MQLLQVVGLHILLSHFLEKNFTIHGESPDSGFIRSLGFPGGYSAHGDTFIYYLRNNDQNGFVKLSFDDWHMSSYCRVLVSRFYLLNTLFAIWLLFYLFIAKRCLVARIWLALCVSSFIHSSHFRHEMYQFCTYIQQNCVFAHQHQCCCHNFAA